MPIPADKRNWPSGILRALWCLLAFMLPLRWCYAAITTEQANMPMSIPEWLIFTIWPQLLLPAFSGALLLCSAALHRRGIAAALAQRRLFDASAIIALLTFSPLLAGLFGLVHTTEWGYAANWYWHFYTISCVSCGVWLASRFDAKLLPWLFNTIAATALLAALEGWHQHFGGLADNLQLQIENARDTGIILSEQLIEKMRQTRSYGHFMDPNAYAAQLLLTCPILLVALKRLGQRCTPPRLSQILLVGAGIFLSGGALLFSGSRGGIIGAIAGVLVFAWVQWGRMLSRRQLLAMVTCCAAAAIAAVMILNWLSNRRFETASVRMEYYATASRIFARFPVCGAGLGEFFPWHMRLKPWQADEARDPHSMLFAMLSQCGIPGGIDALLRLLLPAALAFGWLRHRRSDSAGQCAAALSAWCAWNAHAMLQFNDMIIATATCAGFIGLFAFRQDAPLPSPPPTPPASGGKARMAFFAITLIAGLAGLSSLRMIPSEIAKQRAENELRNQRQPVPAAIDAAIECAIRLAPRDAYPQRLKYDWAVAQDDFAAAANAAWMLTRLQPHRSSNWIRYAMAVRIACQPDADAVGKVEHVISESLRKAELWYPANPGLWLTKAMLRPDALGNWQLRQSVGLKAVVSEIDDHQVTMALLSRPPFPLARINIPPLQLPDGRTVKFRLR